MIKTQKPAAEEVASRSEDKLRRELGSVMDELEKEGTEDILLNPDGILWAKRRGQPFVKLGAFPAERAMAAMASIAHYRGTEINHDNPILETELPFNGSRFEGLVPPIVKRPCFAIRPRPKTVFTLEEYVQSGVLTEVHAGLLRDAIRDRKNVLVVGSTGSGKTTLVNAVLDSIARITPDHRVLLIEDTPELQCNVDNFLPLLAAGNISMSDCLKACMRLTPDRIIVGEVRGGEALTLLKSWNTGHPGGVTTVHANDAVSGLLRLESLAAEATAAPQQKFIGEVINIVVFISKDRSVKAGRKVREVCTVTGYNGHTYEVEYL
ncbi:MAG: P-type conjugative transfer ATPase TrbB [Acidobacteriaceae bacterium]|nr:P-type conjugative transfer ATPase TrbB [Acidobacteriaceae bacterium]